MNIKKEFLKRFILGAPFGVVLSEVMILLSTLGVQTMTLDRDLYIRSLVVSFVMAGYLSGISVIYSVDKWGLQKQTAIHLALITPYFIVAGLMNWMPGGVIEIATYLVIWAIAYIVIWNTIRLHYKKVALELDAGIKAFQSK